MELRELILSTLAEIEEELVPPSSPPQEEESKVLLPEEELCLSPIETTFHEREEVPEEKPLQDEPLFLEAIRERLLVLFEGLQSPDVVNLEDKMEITLNFLEYLLASTEERLSRIKEEIA